MTKLLTKQTAKRLADRLRNDPKDATVVARECSDLNVKYRDFVEADAAAEDLEVLIGIV
jgi:hypothetical protein